MKSTITIVFILFLFGCNSRSSIESHTLSLDEYDVYKEVIASDVINNRFSGNMASINSFCVFQKTLEGKMLGEHHYSEDSFPLSKKDTSVSLKWFSTSGEWDTLVSNFKAISKDTIEIDSTKLRLSFNYVLSNKGKASIHNISVAFSRVGFNPKQNEALVYYRFYRFEGDEEYLLLLKKENNRWAIVNGYGWYLGALPFATYYIDRMQIKVK